MNNFLDFKETAQPKRHYIKTEPVFIKKLVKVYGEKRTASELGMSTTAIKNIIKLNSAVTANELAATLIWDRLEGSRPHKLPKKLTVIIQFDDTHLFSIQTILKSLGVKMTYIDNMEF